MFRQELKLKRRIVEGSEAVKQVSRRVEWDSFHCLVFAIRRNHLIKLLSD
jgi:hypothetical protein